MVVETGYQEREMRMPRGGKGAELCRAGELAMRQLQEHVIALRREADRDHRHFIPNESQHLGWIALGDAALGVIADVVPGVLRDRKSVV